MVNSKRDLIVLDVQMTQPFALASSGLKLSSRHRQRNHTLGGTPTSSSNYISQDHSKSLLQVALSVRLRTAFFLFAIVIVFILHFQFLRHSRSSDMISNSSPHVIIIGGGLAGLSAAAQALASGAHITLVEKHKLGGNSAKATSGINGVPTQHQTVADTIDLFVQDIIKSGQDRTDRCLAHVLSGYSAAAVEFLEEKLNRELSDVAILGGHSRPRTHRLPTSPTSKPVPIGFTVIHSLRRFLLDEKFKNRIRIMENTSVTDLKLQTKALPDGAVQTYLTGVQVSPSLNASKTIHNPKLNELLTSDAVVISSGGFSADLGPDGLVSRHSKIAANCPYTTNGEFATGDLLKIGQRLGLETVDLDQIQLHPTSFVDPKNLYETQKFLCPEVFRGSGALLLTRRGKRFVDELERRDIISSAINQFGSIPQEWKLTSDIPHDNNGNIVLLLMNSRVRAKIGEPIFDFYRHRGFIQELGNRQQAVSILGFDQDTFTTTLNLYNEALQRKTVDLFGKKTFPVEYSENDILYSAFVTPAVHYTMGGLKINSAAQVMKDRQPIVNLFAAGEVVGGLHGANRLGGNGMLESVVFGRLAGQNAASMNHPDLDPFQSNHRTVMTVSEIKSLSNTSPDFLLLRLSFCYLNQRAYFQHGQPFNFSVTLHHRRHSSVESGSIKYQVTTPICGSTPGYLDVLVPVTGNDGLKVLHPGDKIEVEPFTTGDRNNSETVMSSCVDKTKLIVATHALSSDINTIASLATHAEKHPELQLKAVLLCPPSIDCAPLVEYLRTDMRPNVDVEVVKIHDTGKTNTSIITLAESNELLLAMQLQRGIPTLESCWSFDYAHTSVL